MVTKIRGTGDALAPAVTGVDGDSGLLFPVANTVALATGGVERLRIDGNGNAGLGVTPSAWNANQRVIEIGGTLFGVFASNSTALQLTTNFAGTNYKSNGFALRYTQNQNVGGEHAWWTAPSGTAGTPVTITQAMTLTNGGNLLLGTSTDSGSRATFNTAGGVDNFIRLTNGNAPSGLLVGNFGNGDAGIVQAQAAVLGLYTNNTERARITSGGYFKASNTGTYEFPNQPWHESVGGGVFCHIATGTIASGGNSVFEVTSKNVNAYTNLYSGYNGPNTQVYVVRANGNVQNTNNSYTAISDEKLKENITPASPKLPGLMEVEFVNFNFKEETGYETHKQFGVIAQQIETIFPGLVASTPDRDEEGNETGTVTKSVNYSVLALFACKALQEAKAEIDELRNRIEQLESGV